MRLSIDCLPCLLNQAVKIAKVHLKSEEDQRRLTMQILLELASIDDNASAPYAAQKIHQALKDVLQNLIPTGNKSIITTGKC